MRNYRGRKALRPWSLDAWLKASSHTLAEIAAELGISKSAMICYRLGRRVAPLSVRQLVADLSEGAVAVEAWPAKFRPSDKDRHAKKSKGDDKRHADMRQSDVSDDFT